jgi:predicted DNA-binding transcriptional regulator YafY
MSRLDRLVKLSHWLRSGRCISRVELMTRLEVSRSTVTRDIGYLRDRLSLPIRWSSDGEGWKLERRADGVDHGYEMPGLWLSAEDLHALLTMQQLLAGIDAGGIIGSYLAPLSKRLAKVIDGSSPSPAELSRRIKVLTIGARRMNLPHFQAVASALLQRQRLQLRYRSRSAGEASEREVSPQRLVHYRDNWYLGAWCHWRQALRSFSVDAITRVQVLDQSAIEVDEAELDAVLGAGYGIFAGREIRWATLRFSAERARWVAAERWHPQQHGRWDAERRWVLTLPFADPRELVMDILRHVPEVEVIAPDELCEEVARRLREGLRACHGLNE